MEINQPSIEAFIEAYIDNVPEQASLSSGNTTPIALDILNSEGHICYANQKCIELFAFDPAKAGSYTLFDLAVHDKQRKELEDHIDWLVNERPYPTPYIGQNKTLKGEVINVRVNWDYLVHKGEVLGFICVISNLSERIPSLERYRANEAIVNAMVQTMLCGVMILGTSGEILEANTLCAQALNKTRNEILGHKVSDLLTPTKMPDNMSWTDSAYSKGSLVNEYRLNEKVNNRRRYILIESASALLYRSMSSLIVFVKDVTNERLEQRALAVKKREIEQRYRQTLLTEMISGLAHEINQPLAAITNYTKGCMRRLESQQADPAILQSLDMVVRQANRASNIIKHMRQWNSEDLDSFDAVNVKKLINESIRFLEFDLREAKIQLNQHITIDCPNVYGCQIQLEQVVINLLRNAIDAINQRAKYDVEAPKQISIEVACQDAGMVEIMIRDSGIGISEQDAEHLFEPFYTTKEDGMGIGLALSEKIMGNHHGRLKYCACEGDYVTCFMMALPAHVEASAESEVDRLKEMVDYSSKVWVSL